ncbi:MAG: response regulator [Cyclobacteriaceae bacterium]
MSMKTICIVEDTEDLLENLTAFLSLEGFRVMACSSATEALEKLSVEMPDMIITDLWMPGMDGYAFIDRVKATPGWGTIPIMVFTAAPLKPDERVMLESKTHGIVVKPVAMESFLETIKAFFNKLN